MEHKKVLVIGHSIVRRFYQFLTEDDDDRYVPGLGLSATHDIRFRGVGGRLVNDVLRYEGQHIDQFSPRLLVLMIGGNDVIRKDTPAELAAEIEAVVTTIHIRHGVDKVYVCKLLPRFRQGYDYNQFADAVNSILRISLPQLGYSGLWEHCNLFPSPSIESCERKFIADGVHLNKQGNVHLYRSLKGLILSRY